MNGDMELALAVRGLVLAAERYRAHRARGLLAVSPTEMIALGVLQVEGPQIAAQLARTLGITAASATELCDRLQQAGLVERRSHATDRRKRLIHLTPRAEQAVTALYREMETVISDRCPASREAVLDFLRSAATALARATDPPVPDPPVGDRGGEA